MALVMLVSTSLGEAAERWRLKDEGMKGIPAIFRSSPTGRDSSHLKSKKKLNIFTKDLFIGIISYSSFLLLKKHKPNF